MIGTILVIALLSIAGSIIYYRSWEFLPFLFGVLLGTAASIVRVILLERSVEKISALSPQRAKNQIVAQQMGSMVLTLVVLLIAALVPQISLWGAAAGIVAFHPAIYIANFRIGKQRAGKLNSDDSTADQTAAGQAAAVNSEPGKLDRAMSDSSEAAADESETVDFETSELYIENTTAGERAADEADTDNQEKVTK